MKPLIIHSEAEAELDNAMLWYEQRQHGLGLELQGEVDELLNAIRNNSEIGTPYKSTGYRFLRTKRFPFLLYYLELENEIWIAAIVHGRRRPDFWMRRISEQGSE